MGAIVVMLPLPSQANERLVIWAGERPEDLRFGGRDIEIAAQIQFIVLTGDGVFVRRRRFPLLSARPPSTLVAHIQIDHHVPLVWSRSQRASLAAVVIQLARTPGAERVQVDFEVRQSERRVLLDMLDDVRRGLPQGVKLSMTALASWCDTEAWLKQAPVDEIVPMLFRMGPRGEALKIRFERGQDFREARCRSAFGVSSDEPLGRVPGGRRVYVFNPRSWTAASYANVRQEAAKWALGGG